VRVDRAEQLVAGEPIAVRARRAAAVRLDEEQREDGCRAHPRHRDDRALAGAIDVDLHAEPRRGPPTGRGRADSRDGAAQQAHAHESIACQVAVLHADAEQRGDRRQRQEGAAEEANQIAHGVPRGQGAAMAPVDGTKEANRGNGTCSRCRMR